MYTATRRLAGSVKAPTFTVAARAPRPRRAASHRSRSFFTVAIRAVEQARP